MFAKNMWFFVMNEQDSTLDSHGTTYKFKKQQATKLSLCSWEDIPKLIFFILERFS